MNSNEEGMGRESHDTEPRADARSDRNERALLEAAPTPAIDAVSALTDAELLASTRRLTCQSNRVLAALLAHLAEVETRGVHRTRACATLYTYCIYELRMSEDAAYRRVAAARLVKRFPLLFGAIERGELHLTGLLQLGPHLTEANLTEVLARAQFRTKKEIEKLVRLLSPLPDVPSRIEPLGLDQRRPAPRATWANLMAARHPVRNLPPDERPASWLSPAEDLRPSMPDSAPEASLVRADSTGSDSTPTESERASASASAPARMHSLGSVATPTEFEPERASASASAPARMHSLGSVATPTEFEPERASASASAPARVDSIRAEATLTEPEPAGASACAATETPAQGAPAPSGWTVPQTLCGPQRYCVQFTASEEYVALVEEAKALLAHALPAADLAEIHLRALRVFVTELKKRKYAIPSRRVEASDVADAADVSAPATAKAHVSNVTAPATLASTHSRKGAVPATPAKAHSRKAKASATPTPAHAPAATALVTSASAHAPHATALVTSASAHAPHATALVTSASAHASNASAPAALAKARASNATASAASAPAHSRNATPPATTAPLRPSNATRRATPARMSSSYATAPAAPASADDEPSAPARKDESNRLASHARKDEPNQSPSHARKRDASPSPQKRVRTIPAAVRRIVFERDGHRCAYVDDRGVRCRETSRLELHHHEPFAHGGPPSAENLSLYCASHNALAADRDFGRAFAIAQREHPHVTERSRARAPLSDV